MLQIKSNDKGFTLIEAVVAMVIFGIAFTGLYLVFGIAMKGANDAQKRMHLNLIANQIVESISAETRRDPNDDLNPLKTPDIYNANLQNLDLNFYQPTKFLGSQILMVGPLLFIFVIIYWIIRITF